MRVNRFLTLVILLLLTACSKENCSLSPNNESYTVGFYAGGSRTRTTIDSNGSSTSWSKDDKIALWAVAADGSEALSAQPFKVYYRETPRSLAMFTSDLGSAMNEGTYNYYATYPTPNSFDGTQATFTIPTQQDGLMSSGAAIMVAKPAQGTQLGIVTGDKNNSDNYEIEDNHLSLEMNHVTHALKFFVMEDKWGFDEGEKIERIIFTMPQPIAGEVTLDYTNPATALTTSKEEYTISMYLAKSIGPSSSSANIDFAAAAIIPTEAFNESDEIEIKVYSQRQVASSKISLAGRDAMLAGHTTPVSIDCSHPTYLPKITFNIIQNNLGENINKITLTADSSTKWKENDDNIYEYYPDTAITKGNSFSIYYDESTIESIKGIVTVTYESKNAVVSNTIEMSPMTAGNNYSKDLTIPYLFAEDFSSLKQYDGDFNAGPYTSTDAASTAALDLSEFGLSTGWTGARTGCQSTDVGVAILVAGRVDCVIAGATRAYGRLESPALKAIRPGAKPNVQVSFTYSGSRSGNSTYYPVARCGYSKTSGLLNGYATQFNNDPAFDGISGAVEIPSIPTNGSSAAATTPMSYTIEECTMSHRLSWHVAHMGYKSFKINNGCGWIYIDNITVQIVP